MARSWGEYWNPVTKKVEDFKSPTRKGWVDIKESQIGSQTYWKLKNNPMYKSAADALDIDWDEFIADADASLGSKADWDDYEPETNNVDEYERAYDAWSNDEDSDRSNMPKKSDFTGSGLNKYGIGKNNDIFNQINEMDEWLLKTSKTQSLKKAPLIAKGPSPSDYGMEGDNIFAALGIDKAPGAPRELDVDYKMNLTQARTSTASYNTPSEYTKVNLHEA